MSRKIFTCFTILLTLLFNNHVMATHAPDFRYPKDVKSVALADIKAAKKANDGQQLIDALIRYSIAEGLISRENADTVFQTIDEYIASEKNPVNKALLCLLQADIYLQYDQTFNSRDNAIQEEHDQAPAEVAEWNSLDFKVKVFSLISQMFEHRESLKKRPISEFKSIIKYSDNDIKFYPTLLDFCIIKVHGIVAHYNPQKTNDLINYWASIHTNDVAPSIFIANFRLNNSSSHTSVNFNDIDFESRDKSIIETYHKYQQFEESGIILSNAQNSIENYALFVDYLKRFPDSKYHNNIKNKVNSILSKSFNITFAKHNASNRDIKLRISHRNINDLYLHVFSKSGKNYSFIKSYHLSFDQDIPHLRQDTTFLIDPLPCGEFLVFGSFDEERFNPTPNNNYERNTFFVSDIRGFAINSHSEEPFAVAVNAITGEPIEGATLFLQQKNKNVGISDENGKVGLHSPRNSHNYQFRKGNDIHSQSFSYWSNSIYHGTSIDIFTDLAIYRPGETINYAVVVCNQSGVHRNLQANQKLKVEFRDSNYKQIATDTLTTGADGRASGKFTVPTDRMNGNFSIKISTGTTSASKRLTVSEYKTPRFIVDFGEAPHNYNTGEDVKIVGKIATYAGMPVANAKVKTSLSRALWSWFTSREEFLKQDTILTDNNGNFTLTISHDLFERNGYSRMPYCYSVEASCTNSSGETQSATHNFFVGIHRRIKLPDELTHINDKPLSIPATIESSDPADAHFTCKYRVISASDTTNIVAQGTFKSNSPSADLTALPSGQYTIFVEDASGLAESTKAQLILFRSTDKLSPVARHLWIPECGQTVDSNNAAHITIGTNNDNTHIFYFAASNSKMLSSGWLHFNKGLHTFYFELPFGENEITEINFISFKDYECHQASAQLISKERTKSLKLETTTFRDNLYSGGREKWSFRIIDNHGNPVKGFAMLALTDMAVNNIKQNIWKISSPNFLQFFSNINLPYTQNSSLSYHRSDDFLTEYTASTPYLNYYDQHFFQQRFGRMVMYKSANSLATSLRYNSIMKESESVEEEMMLDAAAPGSDYGIKSDAEHGAVLDNITLRTGDIKTALWMPNIVSENDGSFHIEFDVPNHNSTWLMQAVAYNEQTLFNRLEREVVTSKPIMVKANMPRFLRTGDTTALAANLANKTDKEIEFVATIELFDPRTEKILASQAFKHGLAAMSDTSLTINFTAPADADFVGFRIKASNGRFGDGEQVMVPVLSDVDPVIETETFFIDAKTSAHHAMLPNFKNDARITLEYCNNPMWYCVTALPSIFNKDARSSSQLAHSLYALTLAEGVANSNPKIAEAINYWKAQPKEHSALTSSLEKNADLKIGNLLASPWINEAERQTLRMNSLDQLFDKSTAETNRQLIIAKLKDLQLADGGFTWIKYDNCKSSLSATTEVLQLMGELFNLGYLTDDSDINSMVGKAVKYMDTQYNILFRDAQKHKLTFHNFYEYIYIHQQLSKYPIPDSNKNYAKRIISDIEKNWGKCSITDKAYQAIVLNREGKKNSARKISESIRQYGITTPNRGMYWDAIDTYWYDEFGKLRNTLVILEALNEVDQRKNEIDEIRKWVLLNKQTNDWGNHSLASHAVYTILSTGSNWLTTSAMPTISIGNKTVIFDDIDQYLGYARKEILATDAANANITIERTDADSPAWGAVYCQYAAPVTTIKEKSVDDLSVTKTFLVYDNDGKLKKAKELKVGDKVRIQCTIKCGKSMECITLNDQRGACFEPVEKISHYSIEDNCFMYHEIKDSATNIFIPFLNKDTYVIGYDVYVTNPGSFNIGIATIQCQYAPQFSAHSAGFNVIVK